MKYLFMTLLLTLAVFSFVPRVNAVSECFWYNPNGGSELVNYCPTTSNPWPADMYWGNVSNNNVTYQYAPTKQQRKNFLISLNEYIRNPDRYIYWRKTQTLTGENGKELGAVFVQRNGNTLEITYELTSYKCSLEETNVNVSGSEDGLPLNMHDFMSNRQYGGYYATGDMHLIDASRWSPTQKVFIAAYARVRCEGGSGRTTAKIHDAWGGTHVMPGINNGSYITYKAVAADNPPVAHR